MIKRFIDLGRTRQNHRHTQLERYISSLHVMEDKEVTITLENIDRERLLAFLREEERIARNGILIDQRFIE